MRTLASTPALALLALILHACASAQAPAAPPQPRERPPQRLNVVLIILDDVRWDALGAAGNGSVR
ncbi:MAG: hypothetical protein H6Q91_3395, partial [Deltaproteobacteria bacterium]|nr:hypothetical protein [Deltaproteobacteria bacterium]